MAKKSYSIIFVQDPYNPTCLMSLSTYGTKYYEELEVIRTFRDKMLGDNLRGLGKNLVEVYYKISSLLAPKIKKSSFWKKFILHFLVRPLIWLLS